MSWWVSANSQYFLNSQLWRNKRLYKGNIFHVYQIKFRVTFSCLLNWKFISRVRFEVIKRDTTVKFQKIFDHWKTCWDEYFKCQEEN